jgi:hypothetical protein
MSKKMGHLHELVWRIKLGMGLLITVNVSIYMISHTPVVQVYKPNGKGNIYNRRHCNYLDFTKFTTQIKKNTILIGFHANHLSE